MCYGMHSLLYESKEQKIKHHENKLTHSLRNKPLTKLTTCALKYSFWQTTLPVKTHIHTNTQL